MAAAVLTPGRCGAPCANLFVLRNANRKVTVSQPFYASLWDHPEFDPDDYWDGEILDLSEAYARFGDSIRPISNEELARAQKRHHDRQTPDQLLLSELDALLLLNQAKLSWEQKYGRPFNSTPDQF